MTILLAIAKFAAISACIYLAIALGLIASQAPNHKFTAEGLKFPDRKRNPIKAPEASIYTARDGAELAYRIFPSGVEDAPLLVFVHGSSAHGAPYAGFAQKLAQSGAADVLLPDLRGHGLNIKHGLDVAYIGQFEDDLADLIAQHKKPGQKVVIGGHSSGGGLAIRYAGGAHGADLDGAVLLAPFLKYNAPTLRPNSGGWAHVPLRRLIGLVMLNMAQIKVFNGLTAIQFNVPEKVKQSPTGRLMRDYYSFAMNTSYAPRNDYLSDIAKLPKFILVVGQQDEAFVADQYAPLMQGVTQKGRYEILPNVSHLAVTDEDITALYVAEYLKGL
ncbi:MAG: alpha/beta hydrolase [Rhodobacteraceae bacterium]|nr:MAG: alpha/beta hydrolase [Paracoccaceae bacterium]